MKSLSGLACCLLATALFNSSAARAQTVSFQEFGVPTPSAGLAGVAVDTNGDAWFTEMEANRIGRLVPGQPTQEFSIATPDSGPSHIAGINLPFGEMWFTESRSNKIGRLAGSEITLPTPACTPIGIADGRARVLGGQIVLVAWVTEFSGNKIARVFSDGTVKEFPIPTLDSRPWGITALYVGRDSYEIWFTESNAGKIGKLDETTGMISEYSIPTPDSGPRGIAASADGTIWFTEYNSGKLGRITRAGVITEFSTSSPSSGPFEITAGRAGDMWFTEQNAGRVGVMTPDLSLKELTLPTSGAGLTGIALGTQFFLQHFPPPAVTRLVVAQTAENRLALATADWIVVPGAGSSGDWDTDVRISNRESFSLPVQILGVTPSSGPSFVVPAAGSTRVSAMGLPAAGWSTWVINPNSFFLPSVDARVFQRGRPGVSAGLPATRLSTLRTLAPKVLSFPGAQRTSGGARSNLFLTFLDSSFPLLVRIDALSSEGRLLGSLDLELRHSVYLTDIVSRLSGSSLDDGQIRVTLLSGDGIVWGYLATAGEDGSTSFSVGANP
jgi:virginiamycin B lyase